VPRLSIIVPYLHDDSRLEQTVLSILENQPNGLELLIVHDGQYLDPYGLGQDEAVLIETERGTNLMCQVNRGVASACSPYIQVIMPGATVDEDWLSEPLAILRDEAVDVVVQRVACDDREDIVSGLSVRSLPHRRVADDQQREVSPSLLGSVFRKRFLKATSGWFENVSREVAEVEMGLLIESLGAEVVVAKDIKIHAEHRLAAGSESGYEIGHACGQLATAYASIQDSGIVLDSIARRLGHLASGLMSPKTVAERLGWVLGLRNRSYVQRIQERLASAIESSACVTEKVEHRDIDSSWQHRRAA
jgi:hypothetical protein